MEWLNKNKRYYSDQREFNRFALDNLCRMIHHKQTYEKYSPSWSIYLLLLTFFLPSSKKKEDMACFSYVTDFIGDIFLKLDLLPKEKILY